MPWNVVLPVLWVAFGHLIGHMSKLVDVASMNQQYSLEPENVAFAAFQYWT